MVQPPRLKRLVEDSYLDSTDLRHVTQSPGSGTQGTVLNEWRLHACGLAETHIRSRYHAAVFQGLL